MGDFNINWLDKVGREKLKNVLLSFQMEQIVQKPTLITRISQTQIDLIFTNKLESIVKKYNLLTGLSDHNLTLVSRKLSKARLQDYKQVNKN